MNQTTRCVLEAEDIKLAIDNSPDFAIKCLMTIYDNQTQDEKEIEDTKYTNGIGFSGADAYILSSFAEQVQKFNRTPEHLRIFKYPLSYKQFKLMQKKIKKYAKQLSNYLRVDVTLSEN